MRITWLLILISFAYKESSGFRFRQYTRRQHTRIVSYKRGSNNIEPTDSEKEDNGSLFNQVKEIGLKISIPNILTGATLGSLITLFALFSPYFSIGDGSTNSNSYSQTSSIEKSITLFEDILVDLKNGYVDTVNPEKLFETAVGAMLKSLDPYTEFENLGDAKSMAESVSGKYGGVGMVIAGARDAGRLNIEKSIPALTGDKDKDKAKDTESSLSNNNNNNIRLSSVRDKGIVVVDAFEGYAFDNKIRVGDRIIAIDGRGTRSMDVEGVRSLLRGEPGTRLTIEVERDQFIGDNSAIGDSIASTPGKVTKSFTITRQQVKMSDIRLATFLGEPKDGIGYIALSGFNADASRDFAQALLMLRYSAPFGLNGLVFDLRGNPGGLLDAAVDIASYLVPPDSSIVSAKAKNEPEVVFKSSANTIRPNNMQLAVLVNGGSASAAEIVSGAIQDLDAGIIVGPERTYGKGLVQKIVPLPYENALKYTVAKYYTPSGRCIQAVKYLGGRDDESKIVPVPVPAVDRDSTRKPETDQETTSIITPVNPALKDAIAEERLRTGDGATLISEDDRQTFYTLGGRPVKDGGGIEPDVLVEPFKLSAIESALLSQNAYADFVSEYLRNTAARAPLTRISEMEQQARKRNSRYDDFPAQSPLARFFVLPTRYSHDSLSGTDKDPLQWEWENELLTLEDTKRTTKTAGDKLFTDFKRFVERKYTSGEITLDGVVSERLDALEKVLHDEGLEKAEEGFKSLRLQIGRNLLAEMDKHRAFISDSLELTLLSHELPDRLLVYRAIVSDPQVEVARKLLTTGIAAVTTTTNSGDYFSLLKTQQQDATITRQSVTPPSEF